MSLNLEQALAAVPTVRGKACKFGPWLLTLSEDDRNAVAKAMDNPELETRHIFRTLQSVGCPSGESSVRTHRARECQHCERELHGQPG
jgi:hypothetical protein